MAELYAEVAEEEERLARAHQQRNYWDRKTFGSYEEQQRAMARSSTLYVGNLSFFTSEAQIYELFSRVGTVKRVIMGLDRFKKTPCGFCFVEYMTHGEAIACANFLSETKLDNRVVRCEMDGGFREGRQFGRGLSGGQVRDDRRSKDEYDPGRGGYGRSDNAGGDAHHFRRSSHYGGSKRPRDGDQDDEPPRKQPAGDADQEVGARCLGGGCCFHEYGGANATLLQDSNPRFRRRESDQQDEDDAPEEPKAQEDQAAGEPAEQQEENADAEAPAQDMEA